MNFKNTSRNAAVYNMRRGLLYYYLPITFTVIVLAGSLAIDGHITNVFAWGLISIPFSWSIIMLCLRNRWGQSIGFQKKYLEEVVLKPKDNEIKALAKEISEIKSLIRETDKTDLDKTRHMKSLLGKTIQKRAEKIDEYAEFITNFKNFSKSRQKKS